MCSEIVKTTKRTSVKRDAVNGRELLGEQIGDGDESEDQSGDTQPNRDLVPPIRRLKGNLYSWSCRW